MFICSPDGGGGAGAAEIRAMYTFWGRQPRSGFPRMCSSVHPSGASTHGAGFRGSREPGFTRRNCVHPFTRPRGGGEIRASCGGAVDTFWGRQPRSGLPAAEMCSSVRVESRGLGSLQRDSVRLLGAIAQIQDSCSGGPASLSRDLGFRQQKHGQPSGPKAVVWVPCSGAVCDLGIRS